MSEEQWGPWIDHDGKGCPCVGMWVHLVRLNGAEEFGLAGSQLRMAGESITGWRSAWYWQNGKPTSLHIIRYRIRKPRGLTILEELLTKLPEEVDA